MAEEKRSVRSGDAREKRPDPAFHSGNTRKKKRGLFSRGKRKRAPALGAPQSAENVISFEEEAARRKPAGQKEKAATGGFDVPFFMLLMMLLFIGLVMLFSASYVSAYYVQGNATHFLSRQAVFAGLGIVAMLIVANIPYQFMHKLAVPALLVALVLLVAVLFIGTTLNNARRWIGIGDYFTIQPSEVAKAAVILCFSSFAVRFGSRMKTFTYGILPFLIVLGVMAALLMKEPHLSATVIIMVTGIVILFLGGASIEKLAILGAAGGGAVAWLVFGMGYGMDRINVWLHPEQASSDDAFQIMQSLYAIGSGGLWGLGLGQSRQKQLFLPEPYNDFIFSIVCEELGFVGAALVLILFAALIIRGYYIALRAKDTFGTLLAAGVITQFAVQTIFNIGVVTGLLPVTGVSLPLFSQGGTSMVVLFAELGLVLSVSKQIPAPRQG